MDEELVQEAHARVGTSVGKYRLDAVLGVGGTASVYAGSHRNGNRVAIKVLHSSFSGNESMRSRFLREGYVANKVEHAGAVRVIDDDTQNDVTYLVMELLEGETLDQRSLRVGGTLPTSDVVHHGIALLDVLERAHAAGIVHRDLKPENLFFTTRQELKVLDFGIARVRDANVTKTQTGTMLGTPAYLAPEQALGHTDDIDARTDVWATGATLFTLLSGRHVHQGRNPQEALVFAATRTSVPVKQVAPNVPDAVAQIVDRALLFRREDRWQSAAEMKNALLATNLARITVPTGRANPLEAPRAQTIMTSTSVTSAASSTSFAVAGALFGLVALGGIVGGLFLLKRRNTVEPTPAVASSAGPEIEQLPLPSSIPAPPPTGLPAEEPPIVDATAPKKPKAPRPKPSAAPITSSEEPATPEPPKDVWDPPPD